MTDTLEHATDAELAVLLEQDYRRQLRWYPKPWRTAHGDALIGTLMDEADDTDRFTIQPGEWRTFAAAGLTARLDRIVLRRVRDATATVLLAAGAGISLVAFVVVSWTPWGTGIADRPAAFGPFHDAGPVLAGLWAGALLAALAGRWWIGRIALLVSVLVAVLMRPVETWLAPSAFFSLDPGTLTLSALAALLAVMGTPRARLPLIGAAAGWAALAGAACSYQALAFANGGVGSPSGVLFTDPARTSWCIALAFGVAAIFALARFWTPAFTLLLTLVPPTAALAAANLELQVSPPSTYLPIGAPVAAGLVLLVLVSHRTAQERIDSGTRPRNSAPTTEQGARRHRTALIVAFATPVLVLGSTAAACTAAGLDWTRPAGVNWSNYWRTSVNLPQPEGERFFAALTFALPSGGTCTTRFFGLEQLPGVADPAVEDARGYLLTGSEDGTLLRDAQVGQVIAQIRTQDITVPNFWGLPARSGYGTDDYDPDVEYVEAVRQGLQEAQQRHLERAGFVDAVSAFDWTRCSGMQE